MHLTCTIPISRKLLYIFPEPSPTNPQIMLQQAREKARRRTKANRFIRRTWSLRSGLKYWPAGQRKHVWARVVGILPDDIIRIQFELHGDTYQKEISKWSFQIHPLSSEVQHLLDKGWEGLFFHE